MEECAAKVVDELQKTMAFDMGKIQSLENQVEWTVQEGGTIDGKLGTRTVGPGRDSRPLGTSKEAHEVHEQGKSG